MIDEPVKMPNAHHIVMQLRYANAHCKEKECWKRCTENACIVDVIDNEREE